MTGPVAAATVKVESTNGGPDMPDPDLVALHGYDHHDPPLMDCGHAANATWKSPDGPRPSCAICAGIGGKGVTVVERPSLEGRRARCSYNKQNEPDYQGGGRNASRCAGERDSRWGMAFFEHRPDEPFDLYYCGCWGWD